MGKPFFCSTNPNHNMGGGRPQGRFAWGLPFPESSPEGHLPRVGLILIRGGSVAVPCTTG